MTALTVGDLSAIRVLLLELALLKQGDSEKDRLIHILRQKCMVEIRSASSEV